MIPTGRLLVRCSNTLEENLKGVGTPSFELSSTEDAEGVMWCSMKVVADLGEKRGCLQESRTTTSCHEDSRTGHSDAANYTKAMRDQTAVQFHREGSHTYHIVDTSTRNM